MHDIPGKFGRVTTQMPADCMIHGCTRLNARSVIEHRPTCAHYEFHTPPPASGARPRNTVTLEFDPPADPRWPADPPAWWLEAWAAGWMAGHATGFEHGVDAGYAEYGAVLADALKPMRRAAAHGIDVALARRAWENRQARGGDQDAA